MAEQNSEGLIVRGADGALYFLRAEILEECRLPRDLAKQAEALIKDPQGTNPNIQVGEGQSFQSIGQLSGDLGRLGEGFRSNVKASSTVMCPSLFTARPTARP